MRRAGKGALAGPLSHIRAIPASLKDLSLTAQAKASLLAHPMTRNLHLSVGCRNRQLVVSGMVEREELRKVAEEIVAKIPGASGVHSEIVVLSSHRTPVGI